MSQAEAQQIVHSHEVCLHHAHRVRDIKLRTCATSSIHNIIEVEVCLQRRGHIKGKEMIEGRFRISSKTPAGTLHVSTRSIDMIIYARISQQHIHQATAYQSCRSQH